MKSRFKTFILVFLLLYSSSGKAQQCDFLNLVFEGAGIRGIAYAGVVEELEKKGTLQNVQKVGGTSAGAITALMVSLGYSSQEIAAIISSTNFRKFNDGRYFFIGGIFRMKNQYGWYRGERFSKWISKIIEDKTGNSEMSFEDLSTAGYKDLYITGTCLNRQNILVFSRETYPQMKVKDAVRISMSIPLYFQAVIIDSTGKVYNKSDPAKELDVVVDGGILGNFPIFIFDTYETDTLNKQHRIPNFQTIGVRIDSEIQIRNDTTSRELVPMEINDFKDYISSFYVLVLENLNRSELTEEDWARTISISSVGMSPRIKKLSGKQKEMLIKSGRDFTASYLKENCRHGNLGEF